jgi:hypothetical protein
MDCAAGFLKGRADVMAVYRNGERTPAYQFYARNRHHDLVYIRRWRLEEEKPGASTGVTAHPVDEMFRREREALEVFASCRGSFGGYPARKAGHYKVMSGNMNWTEIRHDWTFLAAERQNRLDGYLLLGRGQTSGEHHVVELATRDGNPALLGELLRHAASLCRGQPLHLWLSDDDPVRQTAGKRGAVPDTRAAEATLMIMAKLFDPETLAQAAWDGKVEIPETEVVAWTPLREARLYRGPGRNARRVLLEMKDDILARLLMSRLDLEQAHRQQLVTAVGATDRDLDSVARALPFCPWVHNQIDFI